MAPQKKFVNIKNVTASGKTKKSKGSKDPNAPKRPMTAYFLFMGEKRAEVKNANPDFKVGDIAKELGKMWAGIDVDQKERFEKKAAKLKEVYAKKKVASPKGGKKISLIKTTGPASKKKPAKAAKKMLAPSKKKVIKTAKKTSIGKRMTASAVKKVTHKAAGAKKTSVIAGKKSELAAKKAKATAARKKVGVEASAKKASTTSAASKKNPAAPGSFYLTQFMDQKMGPSVTKQGVSGSRRSTLADLIKFNTEMAHSFYKVSVEDGLETVLYILQAEEDVKKLVASPGAAAAYSEVVVYRDLLLLGDLATISQEKRPYQWIQQAGSLSSPAQAALMTSLLGLAIKLTGRRPSRLDTKLKLPGGKMPGKARGEVIAYLALIQNIADAMAEANKGYKNTKSPHLGRMHADLTKIVGDF